MAEIHVRIFVTLNMLSDICLYKKNSQYSMLDHSMKTIISIAKFDS